MGRAGNRCKAAETVKGDNMENAILVIVTALISGLLATVLTIWWQRRAQVFASKMRVFETLMSYRYMISAEESVKALNSIDIIFYKDKAVRAAYKDFLNETDKKPELNPNVSDKHLKLLEVMSKALKLGEIHWDDIKHTYYPRGLSEKKQEEDALRKIQLQSAAAALKNHSAQQNTPANNQFNQQFFAQLLPDLIKNPDSLRTLLEIAKEYEGKEK